MPRIHKADLPVLVESPVLSSRRIDVDGVAVVFDDFHIDGDAEPVFAGLPDGRCQCPHWGFVVSGRLTLRYADRVEVFDAGDAYVATPGHIPAVTAGTRTVDFSPTAELDKTLAVLAANLTPAESEVG
jgi:hypothetical protein